MKALGWGPMYPCSHDYRSSILRLRYTQRYPLTIDTTPRHIISLICQVLQNPSCTELTIVRVVHRRKTSIAVRTNRSFHFEQICHVQGTPTRTNTHYSLCSATLNTKRNKYPKLPLFCCMSTSIAVFTLVTRGRILTSASKFNIEPNHGILTSSQKTTARHSM